MGRLEEQRCGSLCMCMGWLYQGFEIEYDVLLLRRKTQKILTGSGCLALFLKTTT